MSTSTRQHRPSRPPRPGDSGLDLTVLGASVAVVALASLLASVRAVAHPSRNATGLTAYRSGVALIDPESRIWSSCIDRTDPFITIDDDGRRSRPSGPRFSAHAGALRAARAVRRAESNTKNNNMFDVVGGLHHQATRRKATESRAAQPHFGLPFRYSSTAASSQPADAETVP
jgi:hypothetical protein